MALSMRLRAVRVPVSAVTPVSLAMTRPADVLLGLCGCSLRLALCLQLVVRFVSLTVGGKSL